MSRQRAALDDRDPTKPVSMPAFGRPALARECRRCGKWYPWASYKGNGTFCVNCREQALPRRRR